MFCSIIRFTELITWVILKIETLHPHPWTPRTCVRWRCTQVIPPPDTIISVLKLNMSRKATALPNSFVLILFYTWPTSETLPRNITYASNLHLCSSWSGGPDQYYQETSPSLTKLTNLRFEIGLIICHVFWWILLDRISNNADSFPNSHGLGSTSIICRIVSNLDR